MIDGPSAMAFSDVHGLNRNPSVTCRSQSGCRVLEQVPGTAEVLAALEDYIALVGAAVLQVPGRADAGDAGSHDDDVDKFGHSVKYQHRVE